MDDKDIPQLIGPKGHVGVVHFDVGRFTDINPPSYFFEQQDVLETGFARNKGAGSRLLIAHYIGHAVRLARRSLHVERVVCASEVDVPGEKIANLGLLGGTCDFIVGTVAGQSNFGNSSISLVSNLQRI